MRSSEQVGVWKGEESASLRVHVRESVCTCVCIVCLLRGVCVWVCEYQTSTTDRSLQFDNSRVPLKATTPYASSSDGLHQSVRSRVFVYVCVRQRQSARAQERVRAREKRENLCTCERACVRVRKRDGSRKRNCERGGEGERSNVRVRCKFNLCTQHSNCNV